MTSIEIIGLIVLCINTLVMWRVNVTVARLDERLGFVEQIVRPAFKAREGLAAPHGSCGGA